jgi:hypothetical protein
VNTYPEQLQSELFKRCLDIHAVGMAKLTMGMFWLNPIALEEGWIACLDKFRRFGLINPGREAEDAEAG